MYNNKKYNIKAKKYLGQHFLCNNIIAKKIVLQAGNIFGRTIIEIGAGTGNLTKEILNQGASSVIAIERDSDFIKPLTSISKLYPGKLKIIKRNFYETNILDLIKNNFEKPIIISNLPYNIGTNIFVKLILCEKWPPFYHSMVLMLQKEVAERIVAKSGTKSYGRLSIIAQWRTKVKIAFDVSNNAFFPKPKVKSSVIHVIPKIFPIYCNFNLLEKVTKNAFSQRRKMLRNSLKKIIGSEFLKKIGISETARAENLSIKDYILLSRILE